MSTFARTLAAMAVSAALVAPAAHATTGYFSQGYGTKSKGMAGTGAALSQDAMAAAVNPAGMAFVGDRMDLGVALFSPRREYEVTGMPSGAPGSFGLEPGKVESDSEWFLIPHFGRNWTIDADSSFGVTVYGNGGMNTDYPAHDNPIRNAGGTCPSGTFCAGETGVDLMQLFVAPTYARKFASGNASWGVAPIIAYQRFEAKGVGSFAGFSTDPANLSNRGTDDAFGFGARFGVQGEVSPGVRLGASYQTKISMDEFDKYSGLFAEQGDFDIPATATIGVAWDVTPTSTLLFDYQRIWYGDVNSIANPLLPALGACGMGDVSQCLGANAGSGFGWKNINVWKVGYQWESDPQWTWRVGFSVNDQPIPDSEVLFNILAPGVMERHFTFGFTRQLGANNELSFAAMYAPSEKVSGVNPLDPGQDIELKMQQFEFELSYAWRF
ncbi:MAG: outer membrane protein transport protein [Gammaproteobacteria bacterium]|nr:outer membrane protein transport protein [Gammaproteobacteria bacterium]